MLVLLVCCVVGAGQSTAVAAAVWSTVACLVLFELLAGAAIELDASASWSWASAWG